MLKTNTKQAKENIKKYIVENFDPSGYTEKHFETFQDISSFIMQTFRDEKYHTPNDFRYYHGNEQKAFFDWCAGLPSVLDTCYLYNRSAVEDLGNILEETEEEKNKYTEEEAESRLTYLIYRELKKGELQK